MSYMTTQKAQTLISDLIDEVIEVTNPEGEYPFEKYMNVKDFSRAEDVNYRIAGFAPPDEREILEDIDYDEPLFGEKQTTTPLNWGAGFRVAEETIKDLADAGPWDGVNAARLGSYADYTKRLKRQCYVRADLESALKIINGTSTSDRYKGRESTATALFSASHTNLDNPPLTQSNLSSGASLTETTLFNAITAIDRQRDDRGEFFADAKKYKVLYGPSNRSAAIQIAKTQNQVNTANNTVNTTRFLGDIEWVEVKTFDRANGSAYTGWFVFADNHGVEWLWREKPTFAKNVDFDAVALKYRVTMRGNHRHKFWNGTYGHPPS